MHINQKILEKYPLVKMDNELDYYILAKKRYLLLLNDLVNKDCVEAVLNKIQEETNNSKFPEWKTVIVVGETEDVFTKEELFYFNGVNTFVVFYLVDLQKNKIFMNDSWIFAMGCNFRKYVRKINEIITHE